MAGFFKNLFDSLKLSDEDDDNFEDYSFSSKSDKPVREEKPKKMQDVPERSDRAERPAQRPSSMPSSDGPQVRKAFSASNYGTATYIENRGSGKTLRMERGEGRSKVVPIKTTPQGLEVCVMKPKNFDDSQDICDVLLSNCVAIINLEENDLALSQRIMDFIYGSVYSINAKFFQISDRIFIAAPSAVDVSGDYNDILAQTGYDAPLLNKSM